MKALAVASIYPAGDEAVIDKALRVLEARMRVYGPLPTNPRAVGDYLRLRIADREHEVFIVVFLDAQHRLIACEELFRGTLNQTSVYPMEVVKAALKHNAAAVIFAHNHPSGVAEPSRADELLTRRSSRRWRSWTSRRWTISWSAESTRSVLRREDCCNPTH